MFLSQDDKKTVNFIGIQEVRSSGKEIVLLRIKQERKAIKVTFIARLFYILII